MIDAIRGADPLLAAAVAASIATYIGVALALSGSIPAPVRFVHSLLAAVAASFAGAVAPPGVAQIGLNVPPGFTITTEACLEYLGNNKTLPAGVMDEVLPSNSS